MSQIDTTGSGAASRISTVLCVDDEPNILSALSRLFRSDGFRVRTAESGQAGLALLEAESFDLVISDMRMPVMDGATFLAHVRQRWPDTVRLLLTGHADVTSIMHAVNHGEIYRYITKPWDDQNLLMTARQGIEHKLLLHEKERLELLTARQNDELKVLNASLEAKVELRTTELKDANEKLKTSFVTSIKVFSTLLEMRGGNLAGHSRRVADLSRRIAQFMQLDNKAIQEISIASMLHEIGKVGFPDDLLNTAVSAMKPAQLDAYRKHAAQAEILLLPLSELKVPAEIISAQFERFDGTGFPKNLSKTDIPIGARILTLASDFDNLQIGTLTPRQLTQEEARIIIVHGSGQRYDPAVVAAFVELVGGPARSEAKKATVQEVTLSSRDLQAGMVLSRDLISPSGMLMLSAGHVLEASIVSRICGFEKSGGLKLSFFVRQDSIPPAA